MNNISLKTVSEMTNLLHVCLAKAIDMAMTEKSGQGWFEAFKDYDSKQKDHVLEDAHTSVNKMDLQACLKFLRFRDDYSNIVFEYFGYNFFDQSDDAKTAKLLMTRLLDSLIHNVRNRLLAHASTNMVEGGRDDDMRFSIYGPKEAANDCIRLAQVFARVTDENGVSYYSKMVKLAETKQSYSVSETIRREALPLTAGSFVDICNTNKISVVTGENGEMFFLSSNYDGDIAKVKLYISQNFKNTQTYAVADIIRAEGITVSLGEFVEACQATDVRISTSSNGALVFITANYAGDIAKIKLHLNNKKPAVVAQPQKKSSFPWKPVFAILLVALIAVLTIFILRDTDSDVKPKDSKKETEQVTDNGSGNNYSDDDSSYNDNSPENNTDKEEEKKPRIKGEEKFGTLVFTIDQEESDEIVIHLENGNLLYRFGWGSNSQFIIRTVSGNDYYGYNANYTGLNDNKIMPNTDGTIRVFFDGIDEPIEKILITNFYPLDNNGSPSLDYIGGTTVQIDIEYVE